jgi:hypothetical protein
MDEPFLMRKADVKRGVGQSRADDAGDKARPDLEIGDGSRAPATIAAVARMLGRCALGRVADFEGGDRREAWGPKRTFVGSPTNVRLGPSVFAGF